MMPDYVSTDYRNFSHYMSEDRKLKAEQNMLFGYNIASALHLYFDQSGNAAIGGISVFNNYFFGYIDHVSITYRAKSPKEILDHASLIDYYSFDCSLIFESGSNLLHGSAIGQTVVSERVNNVLQFYSSNAYFQAFDFTALIHLSTQSTGDDWCDSLLGFSTKGQLIAKFENLIVL
ncbi:unnamed protein product [Rotaria sordida]|uniref:Uncharacterized protein n=1 Tax=Rotaria sordida TaxID=392033 RepID=A0A818XTG5_9BILA|nr:unnamed protein product [Rotaria sordida]